MVIPKIMLKVTNRVRLGWTLGSEDPNFTA